MASAREARLAAIVARLRQGLGTAAGLATQTGVGARTIYRDIRLLKSVGVPIIGEAGAGYLLRELPARPVRTDEHPQ